MREQSDEGSASPHSGQFPSRPGPGRERREGRSLEGSLLWGERGRLGTGSTVSSTLTGLFTAGAGGRGDHRGV